VRTFEKPAGLSNVGDFYVYGDGWRVDQQDAAIKYLSQASFFKRFNYLQIVMSTSLIVIEG
jgi:hypothetical protein